MWPCTASAAHTKASASAQVLSPAQWIVPHHSGETV
jgi:hypothetical protein